MLPNLMFLSRETRFETRRPYEYLSRLLRYAGTQDGFNSIILNMRASKVDKPHSNFEKIKQSKYIDLIGNLKAI